MPRCSPREKRLFFDGRRESEGSRHFGLRGHGISCRLEENNYFTEMRSGSEAGSYLRLIDFVYHSTLGLRVIKKKEDSLGYRALPE